jgi:hypothetical protein
VTTRFKVLDEAPESRRKRDRRSDRRQPRGIRLAFRKAVLVVLKRPDM